MHSQNSPSRRASLGGVMAMVEGARYDGLVPATEARTALDAKAPVGPGAEEVTAVVTVTFAIS